METTHTQMLGDGGSVADTAPNKFLKEGDVVFLTLKVNNDLYFLYGDPSTNDTEFKKGKQEFNPKPGNFGDCLPEDFQYCLWRIVPAQSYRQFKELEQFNESFPADGRQLMRRDTDHVRFKSTRVKTKSQQGKLREKNEAKQRKQMEVKTIYCPSRHAMKLLKAEQCSQFCSKCEVDELDENMQTLNCRICDYNICQECAIPSTESCGSHGKAHLSLKTVKGRNTPCTECDECCEKQEPRALVIGCMKENCTFAKCVICFQRKEDKNEVEEKREFLQKRVDFEKQQNQQMLEKIIEKSEGTAVFYGNQIQLMHVMTGRYLVGTEEASRMQSNARSLFITTALTTKTYFRMNPIVKVRSQGGQVYFEDFIDLTSCNYTGFSVDLAQREQFEKVENPEMMDTIDAILDIEAGQLMLNLYSRPSANMSSFLHTQELFRLYLHESGAFLGSDDGETVKLFPVPREDYENPDHLQGFTVWVLDNIQNLEVKEALQWEWATQLRLRHYASGKTMVLQLEGGEEDGQFRLVQNCTDDAIANVRLLAVDEKTVEKGVVIQNVKRNGNACLFFQHNFSDDEHKYYITTSSDFDGDFDNHKTPTTFEVIAKTYKKLQDAFQIMPVGAPLDNVIQRLCNYKAIAKQYVEEVSVSQTWRSRLNPERIQEDTSTLIPKEPFKKEKKMLKKLISDMVLGGVKPGTDLKSFKAPPNAVNQRLALECGLVESLRYMVYASANYLHQDALSEYFKPVHTLVFQALRLCFKNQPTVQKFCMQTPLENTKGPKIQFLDVLLKQISMKMGATHCLNMLVEDNRELLDDVIQGVEQDTEAVSEGEGGSSQKESFISNLSQHLKDHGPLEEIMIFFTKVCSCLGEPIFDNQQTLLNELVGFREDDRKSKQGQILVEFRISPNRKKSSGDVMKFKELMASVTSMRQGSHGFPQEMKIDRGHRHWMSEDPDMKIDRQWMSEKSIVGESKIEVFHDAVDVSVGSDGPEDVDPSFSSKASFMSIPNEKEPLNREIPASYQTTEIDADPSFSSKASFMSIPNEKEPLNREIPASYQTTEIELPIRKKQKKKARFKTLAHLAGWMHTSTEEEYQFLGKDEMQELPFEVDVCWAEEFHKQLFEQIDEELHDKIIKENGEAKIAINDLFQPTGNKALQEFQGYIIAQINMYADLCLGRHYNAIYCLQHMFPYTMLLSLIINDHLPPRLQAAFNKLLLRLWIDRHPHEENCGMHDFPQLLWNFDELKKKEREIKIEDQCALPDFLLYFGQHQLDSVDELQKIIAVKHGFTDYNHMELIRRFLRCCHVTKFKFMAEVIQSHLKAHNVEDVGDMNAGNSLILSLLKSAAKLLSFGFYGENKHITRLVESMIDVLDNKSQRNKKDRYKTTDGTFDAVECKKIACQMLEDIRILGTNYKLQKCVHWFCRNTSDIDPENKQMIKTVVDKFSKEFLSYFPLTTKTLTNTSRKGSDKSFELLEMCDKYIKEKSNEKKTYHILLDLMKYEDDELFQKAFNLFFNLFSEKQVLQQAFAKVELVENTVFTNVTTHAKELNVLVESLHLWVYEESAGSSELRESNTKSVLQKLDTLQKFLMPKNLELLDTSLGDEVCFEEFKGNFEEIECIMRGETPIEGLHKIMLENKNMQAFFSSTSLDNIKQQTLFDDKKAKGEISLDVGQFQQNILWHSGVLSTILKLLTTETNGYIQNTTTAKTLTSCIFKSQNTRNQGRAGCIGLITEKALIVLQFFMKGHMNIQEEVFEQVDCLLKILKQRTVSSEANNAQCYLNICKVFVQLYEDNQKLCNANCPPELHSYMMKNAMTYRNVLLLHFFENQIEPNPQALIPRNQHRTWNVLKEYQKDEQIEVFLKATSSEPKFQQKYIRLIASCTKGNNELTLETQNNITWGMILASISHLMRKMEIEGSLNKLGLIKDLNQHDSISIEMSQQGLKKGGSDILQMIGAFVVLLDELYLKSSIKDFSCIHSEGLQIIMQSLWDGILEQEAFERLKPIEEDATKWAEVAFDVRCDILYALHSYFREEKIRTNVYLDNMLPLHGILILMNESMSKLFDPSEDTSNDLSCVTSIDWPSKYEYPFISALMECVEDVYIQNRIFRINEPEVHKLVTNLKELTSCQKRQGVMAKSIHLWESTLSLAKEMERVLKAEAHHDSEEESSEDDDRNYGELVNNLQEIDKEQENTNLIIPDDGNAIDLMHAHFVAEFLTSEDLIKSIEDDKNLFIQKLTTSLPKKEAQLKSLAAILQRMAKFLDQNLRCPQAESTCMNIMETVDLLCDLTHSSNTSMFPKHLQKKLWQMLAETGFVGVLHDIVHDKSVSLLPSKARALLEKILQKGSTVTQTAMIDHIYHCDKGGDFFRLMREELESSLDYLLSERKGNVLSQQEMLQLHRKRASSVFSLLKEACSNFLQMQEVLKKQEPFNRASFDILEMGATFLEWFVESSENLEGLDIDEIKLIIDNLNFLVAACQGPCSENQLYIAGSPIIMTCQIILATDTDDFTIGVSSSEELLEEKLKNSTIHLIAACLEGRKDKVVHEQVLKQLDYNLLKKCFLELHLLLADPNFTESRIHQAKEHMQTHEETFKLQKKTGTHLMYVWQKLAVESKVLALRESFDNIIRGKDKDIDFTTLSKILCHVEVYWAKTGSMESVWFPRPNEADSLTETTKERFMAEVDISTRDSRLDGLMKNRRAFLREMTVFHRLTTSHPMYICIQVLYEPIQRWTFNFVIFLNLFLLMSSKKEGNDPGNSLFALQTTKIPACLLCAAIGVGIFLQLTYDSVRHYNLVKDKLQEQQHLSFMNKKQMDAAMAKFADMWHSMKLASPSFSIKDLKRKMHFFHVGRSVQLLIKIVLLLIPLYIGFDSTVANICSLICAVVYTGVVLHQIRETRHTTFLFKLLFDVASNGNILRLVLNLVLLILGLVYKQGYFTLLLLDIFRVRKSLAIVSDAVVKPAKSLMSIFELFVLANIIFAAFAFMVLGEQQFCDDCDDDQYCENLWSCFWVILNVGVRTGGDLGDNIASFYYGEDTYYYYLAFLIGFCIIVGVLLFNMVTGVILEQFSSSRDESNSRKQQMDDEAFISGLQRSFCQENGINFRRVVSEDQNPWNYVFLMKHLADQENYDLSGVEFFLKDRIAMGNLDWFPTCICLSLFERKISVEGTDQMEKEVAGINGRIVHLDEQVSVLRDNMTAIKESIGRMEKFMTNADHRDRERSSSIMSLHQSYA